MANIAIPNKLSQTVLTSTLTTLLYTVPADTKAIIKEILLCNTSAASVAVTVYAGTGTAVVDTILDGLSVGPNETKFVTLSTILDAAEIISAGDDTGAVVSCTISGVEVS